MSESSPRINIVPYLEEHQPGIDTMMRSISSEFPEALSANRPSYVPTKPDCYWIALHNEVVVGTVGISAHDDYAELKRMMVAKAYRGNAIGLSRRLLQMALDWALNKEVSAIYLGTMIQFKAAQAFYAKHGFEPISEHELPNSFIKNPVDKLFFQYKTKMV